MAKTARWPASAQSALVIRCAAPCWSARYREAARPSLRPALGQAFADPRLLDALKLRVGDALEFGAGHVRIAGVLAAEPDASGELLQLAPPLMVNRADVDAAGLLGPGSRASYQLMFTGEATAIARTSASGSSRARAIGVCSASRTPSAACAAPFDRAGRFLALAALLAVLLSGVATALAANRVAVRRIDQVAILRCLGARQGDILATFALQLLFTALPACALGVALGMAVQSGLVELLGNLVPDRLPLPRAAPALTGAGIGLLLLLGFALPPLLRLRGVPPMRVLNRSFARDPTGLVTGLRRRAGGYARLDRASHRRCASGRLGARRADRPGRGGGRGGYRTAVAVAHAAASHPRRLAPRPGCTVATARAESVLQLVGLSLSLCALLLLAVVGLGLLNQWRERLPADTPNYFLMNIQPDQSSAVLARLRALGVATPAVEPFGTGRLLAINGRPPQRVDREDDNDDGNRPVNFSRRHFPPANTLTSGRFWAADSTRRRSLGGRRPGRALWRASGR